MQLLSGKEASENIKLQLSAKIKILKKRNLRLPKLVAILIGNNGASETYVASKIKNCEELGIQSGLIRFDTNLSEETLLSTIEVLNNDTKVDGILVQLPLPKHISEKKVIQEILPSKDVDGFHPINIGKLAQGNPAFIPATPYGVILLMQHYNIKVESKHIVIIGRSIIVGRPLSILLSSNQSYGNATVTLCHSHTPNLKELSLQADILVAALGKPGFIKADMIKKDAIVIDVGITRVDDPSVRKGFRIKGDVDFANVAEKVSFITPVPGGVGLMTIVALLKNTISAYLQHEKISESIFDE